MGLPQTARALELKKHVNLIHCSNTFSLVQRKLFNALLFNAYPELISNNQFTVSAKELCDLTGYKSNDYKSLKKALFGLMSIAVEWNVIDDSHGNTDHNWRASSAIASARIDKGICTYEYSSVMKEFLYQPEIYGRINLALLSKFKSSYGLALYENCVRYHGIPQTQWFSLEVFRKLMGVPDDKYIVFRDFKRRVLDISVKEVNLHSPIKIFPELERKHKKVVKIRFRLESKQQNIDKLPVENNPQAEQLENILRNDFGLSIKNIETILSSYELKYIHEKIENILKSKNFISGKIDEPAAYLMSALKKDYKYSKQGGDAGGKKHHKKEDREMTEKQKNEKLQLLYDQYRSKMISDYLSQIEPENLENLVREFEVKIKGEDTIIYNKFYKKKKLEHAAVKSLFDSFVKIRESHKFENMLSFEEFKKQPLAEAQIS